MAFCKQFLFNLRYSCSKTILERIPQVSPNVNGCRSFATTTYNALKEITVNKSGKVTTVEGMPVESTQDANVLRLDNEKGYCAICPNKLDMKVSHTDVLILSQFLRPDGCLLPKRVTGLCTKGQRRLARLVHRAQRAGLLYIDTYYKLLKKNEVDYNMCGGNLWFNARVAAGLARGKG